MDPIADQLGLTSTRRLKYVLAIVWTIIIMSNMRENGVESILMALVQKGVITFEEGFDNFYVRIVLRIMNYFRK